MIAGITTTRVIMPDFSFSSFIGIFGKTSLYLKHVGGWIIVDYCSTELFAAF